MKSKLSIIIVSWNVADYLKRCLDSLLSQPGLRFDADAGTLCLGEWPIEIIVVDNDSVDGTPAMVRKRYPQVRLLKSGGNLGFTGGNNLGIKRARGEYLLLLNPDAELPQIQQFNGGEGVVEIMLRYMDAHPEVGLLGPKLVYGDGSRQPSRRRFPSLMMACCESTLVEQWWPGNPWARRYRMTDATQEEAQRVDWVTGACMLVRREALDQVGLFDTGFFMYSEELDLGRRLAEAGWSVVYLGQAVVVHHEAKSSDQVVVRRQIHFNRSKIRYFAKHHGQLSATVLRLCLCANYGLAWAIESAKYLLRHKTTLRRERMRAYGQLIRALIGWPHSQSEEKP